MLGSLAFCVGSFHFWRFLERGGRGAGVVSALTLGLAQLAKYTAVFLYPIFLVVVAALGGGIWYFLRHSRAGGIRDWRELSVYFYQ